MYRSSDICSGSAIWHRSPWLNGLMVSKNHHVKISNIKCCCANVFSLNVPFYLQPLNLWSMPWCYMEASIFTGINQNHEQKIFVTWSFKPRWYTIKKPLNGFLHIKQPRLKLLNNVFGFLSNKLMTPWGPAMGGRYVRETIHYETSCDLFFRPSLSLEFSAHTPPPCIWSSSIELLLFGQKKGGWTERGILLKGCFRPLESSKVKGSFGLRQD